MAEPFIGTEALASGRLTPYQLRKNYLAVYPVRVTAIDGEADVIKRLEAAGLRRKGNVCDKSEAEISQTFPARRNQTT